MAIVILKRRKLRRRTRSIDSAPKKDAGKAAPAAGAVAHRILALSETVVP